MQNNQTNSLESSSNFIDLCEDYTTASHAKTYSLSVCNQVKQVKTHPEPVLVLVSENNFV